MSWLTIVKWKRIMIINQSPVSVFEACVCVCNNQSINQIGLNWSQFTGFLPRMAKTFHLNFLFLKIHRKNLLKNCILSYWMFTFYNKIIKPNPFGYIFCRITRRHRFLFKKLLLVVKLWHKSILQIFLIKVLRISGNSTAREW